MKKQDLFSYLICIVLFGILFVACGGKAQPIFLDKQNGGDQLIGNWNGHEKITIRYKEGFMKFRFVKSLDSIETNLSIDASGKVQGNVGNAYFENAFVIKNRGAVGKTLNLATDFAIQGELNGSIFTNDSIQNKTISIPLYLVNGKLCGDLFQKYGIDIFPMAGLELTKNH